MYGTIVEHYSAIAVTALDSSKWDKLDGINEDNESARIAASSGVKALQSLVRKILIHSSHLRSMLVFTFHPR